MSPEPPLPSFFKGLIRLWSGESISHPNGLRLSLGSGVLFCFVYTEHNFLVWKTNGSGCYHTTGAIAPHCGFSGVSLDGNCAYVYWPSFMSNSSSVRRAIWFTWFSEPHEFLSHRSQVWSEHWACSGGRDPSEYTRSQINQDRMIFGDFTMFTVNSTAISFKFCKGHFLFKS